MIQKLYRLILTHMPQLVEEGDGKRVEERSALGRTFRKASLFVYPLLLVGIIAWEAAELTSPYGSVGKSVSIPLARDVFAVRVFKSELPETRAIILFASGDGGWSGFEEAIAKTLQKHGYELVGIDSSVYAETDYDLNILQADYGKIAETMRQPFGKSPPPVIVGGWSMGAAQAIAVAGGPHRPEGLGGVLLLDPCSRGRYGLRLADRSDLLPTGPGTFGAEDFAQSMDGLRVVQWHATKDTIDSRTWLASLTAPYREYDFDKSGHYYDHDRDEFLDKLTASIAWLLAKDEPQLTEGGRK
jgi:pimeloyl-ACP methyl ester carboxylesterase